MPTPDKFLRRRSDTGLRRWMWGNTLWLVLTTVVLAWTVQLAVREAQESKAAARLSCERTRDFAPYVARDFEKRDVMPALVLREYRATIPRDCP